MITYTVRGRLFWTTIASIALKRELTDDEFDMEDASALTMFGLGMGSLWVPAAFDAVVGYGVSQPISMMILGGAAASYAIDGDDGLDNYIDFWMNPHKMPKRTWESLKTLKEEVGKLKLPDVEPTTHKDFIDNYPGPLPPTFGPILQTPDPRDLNIPKARKNRSWWLKI
jgi:hypothetical protein